MKTKQEKIKALLVKMTIAGTLPSDMNELDNHIFDRFFPSKAKIEDYAENQALGLFLSEYPSNKSYDDILTLIEQDSEDITVWEPFEYHESEAIIKLIMEHKSCVLYSLNVFLE